MELPTHFVKGQRVRYVGRTFRRAHGGLLGTVVSHTDLSGLKVEMDPVPGRQSQSVLETKDRSDFELVMPEPAKSMTRFQAISIIAAESHRDMPGRPGPYARACAILGLTLEEAFKMAKADGLLGWNNDEQAVKTFVNCYIKEAL